MTSSTSESSTQPSSQEDLGGERVAFGVKSSARQDSDDEIDLAKLWRVLWSGRWLIVGVTLAFQFAGAAYFLLTTPWYRTQVVMVPAADDLSQGIGGPLGGLTSLVGLRIGDNNDAEPMALLRSRGFARDFISDLDLVTVLLADEWDKETGQWKEPDPRDWPDERDAVTIFHEKIFDVSEDRRTGVITVTVNWTDPQVAAQWANTLVERLNDQVRVRALADADRNIDYLRKEMAATTVVTLQQSVARVLEAELQKSMLAQGNKDFAYRVVDRAEVPKKPFRPNLLLIAVITTMLGVIVSSSLISLRRSGTAGGSRGNH